MSSNNNFLTNNSPFQPNQLILHNGNWYHPNDPVLAAGNQQNTNVPLHNSGGEPESKPESNWILNLLHDLNYMQLYSRAQEFIDDLSSTVDWEHFRSVTATTALTTLGAHIVGIGDFNQGIIYHNHPGLSPDVPVGVTLGFSNSHRHIPSWHVGMPSHSSNRSSSSQRSHSNSTPGFNLNDNSDETTIGALNNQSQSHSLIIKACIYTIRILVNTILGISGCL